MWLSDVETAGFTVEGILCSADTRLRGDSLSACLAHVDIISCPIYSYTLSQ